MHYQLVLDLTNCRLGWQSKRSGFFWHLARLASLMPEEISLSLSDIRIGCYAPSGPLNWWSRRLGLPFGSLTIDKLAFTRASLSGGR